MMRRLLEAVSVGALLVNFVLTWLALDSGFKVPDQIPTHFDIAGRPDGWGSPLSLLLLPVVALFLYGAITTASRFPSAFNYPTRVTAQNRDSLQQIALNMMAWIKAELCSLFAVIQYSTIDTARQARNGLSPLLMPLALVIVFGTVVAHIIAMRRA
jgi:uncharacterized membrane protein